MYFWGKIDQIFQKNWLKHINEGMIDRAQKRLDMRSKIQVLFPHSIFKMADDESKSNTSL